MCLDEVLSVHALQAQKEGSMWNILMVFMDENMDKNENHIQHDNFDRNKWAPSINLVSSCHHASMVCSRHIVGTCFVVGTKCWAPPCL